MTTFYMPDGTRVDLDAFAEHGDFTGDLLHLRQLATLLPPVEDLAETLCYIPRYVGGTRCPFTQRRAVLTVGHHLIWCAMAAWGAPPHITAEVGGAEVDVFQLTMEVLAHDLAEVVTNDIPAPVKQLMSDEATAELRAFERGFQWSFLATKPGLVAATSFDTRRPYRKLVKAIDRLALFPEHTLRPSAARQHFQCIPPDPSVKILRRGFASREGWPGALIHHPLPTLLPPHTTADHLGALLRANSRTDVVDAMGKVVVCIENALTPEILAWISAWRSQER